MTDTKKIEQTIAKTLNESSKTIDDISNLSNEIDIVALDKNYGFSSGYNIGIKKKQVTS